MTWLNVNTVNDHSATTNISDTLVRLPKQFIWERDSSLKFRTALQSRDIQRMIHDFLIDNRPDRNVNTSLDAVETILKKRHSKSSSNKKWFDKECLKKHELRTLANLKRRDPLNITLREGYHTVLKQSKKYISHWNQTLQHSQKLSLYYTFKKNYSLSAYLELTRKNPSTKSPVKLRISSHKLRIETGRYDKIPRDERLCSLCNCNKIEDETRFLLDCPSYSSIRDRFFSKVEPNIPFLRLLSHETLSSHETHSNLIPWQKRAGTFSCLSTQNDEKALNGETVS